MAYLPRFIVTQAKKGIREVASVAKRSIRIVVISLTVLLMGFIKRAQEDVVSTYYDEYDTDTDRATALCECAVKLIKLSFRNGVEHGKQVMRSPKAEERFAEE